MRRFYCHCGNELFFDSTRCAHCGRSVGYSLEPNTLLVLESDHGEWLMAADGRRYRLCSNRHDYAVCNGIVPSEDSNDLCHACRLTRTIPDLSRNENVQRWRKLEAAKRRLLFGLRTLGLPLAAPVNGEPRELCFDLLEDSPLLESAANGSVTTGHFDGVITINIGEADEVQRVWQRVASSERYRTLLGHFRHEAGHYYFEHLVHQQEAFVRLFGDPTQAYGPALNNYYANGPLAGWEFRYISAYASAHPLEDWSESFAHYLHMLDTLETAQARGVLPESESDAGFDATLKSWALLSVTLNELNRSLGVNDPYPFVVNPVIVEKLRFVHQAVLGINA